MTEKKLFEPDYGTKSSSSIIKVIGIGGGGGNAVKHMYKDGIQGVEFLICNTDRLALERNPIPEKLVLGESGLGAGANPDVARKLAEESKDSIIKFIGPDTKMLFLTAGMGKGTGTGATPIIAQIARDLGILSVAVVTEPFSFEGEVATKLAEEGIKELKKHVDSLIIVKNQNILKYYNDLDFDTAFGYADDVLKNAVKCIAELITINLDQNIDFNDIKSIMENSGPAMLGLAEAEGEDRVKKVVEGALSCPLLSGEHITNAKNFLFSLSYGPSQKFTINEFDELTQLLSELRSHNAKVIWGRTEDKSLENKIKLAVIVTNYAVDESKMITNIGTGTVSILGDQETITTPLFQKDSATSVFQESQIDDEIPINKPITFDLDPEDTTFTPKKQTSLDDDRFGFLNQSKAQINTASQIQNQEPSYSAPNTMQPSRIVQDNNPPPSTPQSHNHQSSHNAQRNDFDYPDLLTATFDFNIKAPQRVKVNADPRFENDITFQDLYNTPAVQRLRNENLVDFAEKRSYNAYPFELEDDMPNILKDNPD
jgi:cell division protein FtsZ